MLWIHIAAGLLALVFGAVALYAAKGAVVHRRSGMLFAVAMLVMTSSAIVAAAFLRPNIGNVLAGTLTTYLVVTGVLTVKRTVQESRALLFGFMVVALGVGASALALGFAALQRSNGAIDGILAPAFFMFAIVGLAGAALDLRLLIAGHIEGKQRLARHLWRMGYAMWIATMSFFVGQAKLFPQPVRESGVLAIPLLLVTGTLLYWFVRVQVVRFPLARRVRPAMLRASPVASVSGDAA